MFTFLLIFFILLTGQELQTQRWKMSSYHLYSIYTPMILNGRWGAREAENSGKLGSKIHLFPKRIL